MRYVTSIVGTVFCLLSCAAFAAQIAWYNLTSPAQCIVLVVLVVLTALLWLSEFIGNKNINNQQLIYRVIPNNTVFPAVAFIIQYIVTLLYGAAWFPVFGFNAHGLRVVLPQGIFIPLGLEFVLLAIMAVLWVGNTTVNKHTAMVEQSSTSKQMLRSQMQAQISMLKQRVNEQDASILRQIEQKIEALPLQLQPMSSASLQQAYQLMGQISQAAQAPTTQQLQDLLRIVSMLR